MHSLDIRRTFLDFFQSKEHTIKPSSPLVPPPDDPTLLFTTAGMVQFKELWQGAPLPFKRAASVQKCLRAGGKTSDLENVGRTLRHHTFFEMLGNFSFGDYFKREAILWAWEFVIEVVKLPRENLWVSVYLDDDEAYGIWKNEVGLSDSQIIRLGEKENFWGPAGLEGVCGPSSEIYFDLGLARGCGKSTCRPGCDCERYLEFWNLVFPQFYQNEDSKRAPLQRRGIDTGMGLERLAFLLQDEAKSNYETDLFRPIVTYLRKIAKVQDDLTSLHIVSDHIRALVFTIAEGILPSNEGRGYVLRRLLRRALRHGRKLGITEPFLHKLAEAVISIMKEPYPDLVSAMEHVSKVILSEEERFEHTIDYGLYELNGILKKQKRNSIIQGKDIFKLYDTFGFPLDLMQEVAAEKGFNLDCEGFGKLMSEQKERARRTWETGIEKAEVGLLYREIVQQEFTGYDTCKTKTKVILLVVNGKKCDTVSKDAEVEIFLEKTPFYAQGGGQVGDIGLILNSKVKADVLDTKRILAGVFAHRSIIKEGILSMGDEVEATVNIDKRLSIARHHTATHLLQYALREILGDHVKQCGSLVSPDKLRFDFTHFMDTQKEELSKIEGLVNEKVLENRQVLVYMLPLSEALNKGALAFFGDKYGEEVRVVEIGGYSRELCGGTHIKATGEIGLFRILSEGSIASGVRRIEAVCGNVSASLGRFEADRQAEIRRLLKTESEDVINKIKELINQHKELVRYKEDMDLAGILSRADDILAKAELRGEIKVISANMGNARIEHLRRLGDVLKEKIKSGVIVLGSTQEKGKVNIITIVTKNLVEKGLNAGKIVKEIAEITGGAGGGRPDFAQAGGTKPELLSEALERVHKIIR